MTRQSIYCTRTGSEFIFKGLDRNINEIRSLEGVSRCWIEEANTTRLDSWLILDPTIRVPGSQISISYNPERARLRRRGGAPAIVPRHRVRAAASSLR
jgi:phage terminase large subunit